VTKEEDERLQLEAQRVAAHRAKVRERKAAEDKHAAKVCAAEEREADERARKDPEEGRKRRAFKRAKETVDLICKSKKLWRIYEKISENPWTKRINYYFKHGETIYSREALSERGEGCGDRPWMTEERLLNEVATIITLACAYLYGNETPKSTKDAVFWFEMAAGGEYNIPWGN
jgi:hypothetical protein